MNTDDFIDALASDRSRPAPDLDRLWLAGAGLAAALGLIVFLGALGPRDDFAAAVVNPRFLLKLVAAASLGAVAVALLRSLARPEQRPRLLLLAAGPAMVAAAVGFELAVLPAEQWQMAAVGKNMFVCLTFIPMIGIGPLAVLILFLRQGAPTRPVLAGAIAGAAAGGIAAFLYAMHCTEDSPLFVALWYTAAIGMLVLVGAAAGRLALRW